VQLLGQLALTAGVLASLFVQYRFYIARDRSQQTFAVLAAANFLLLTAARTLPVDLPGFVTALLWFGFLFGLAVAIFHEYLPLRE
jgi:tellurite resistance protein TehA-like permease